MENKNKKDFFIQAYINEKASLLRLIFALISHKDYNIRQRTKSILLKSTLITTTNIPSIYNKKTNAKNSKIKIKINVFSTLRNLINSINGHPSYPHWLDYSLG